MSVSSLKFPDKNLYVLVGDQRKGPFDLETVKAKVAAGEISRATFMWYPGLLQWVTVGDHPQFDRRDIATPPPGTPKSTEKVELWIYDRGKVAGIKENDLRQRIRDGEFRRADMVFDEAKNLWQRVDQHPAFAKEYSPGTPPPAVKGGTVAEDVPATVTVSTAPPLIKKATNAPKLPTSEDSSPPSRSSIPTWVYPGVGLAAIAAAVWFVAPWKTLSQPTAQTAPAVNRAPAAAAPTTANALPPTAPALVFPLGSTLVDLAKNEAFKKCAQQGQGLTITYVCEGVRPGLKHFEVNFALGRVSRLEGVFANTTPAGAQQYQETLTRLGAGSTRTKADCSGFPQAHQKEFAEYCKTHSIALLEWKTPEGRSRIWVAEKDGVETPLEAILELSK